MAGAQPREQSLLPYQQEAGVRSQRQVPNPDTPTWDTGVLSAIPNACPSSVALSFENFACILQVDSPKPQKSYPS